MTIPIGSYRVASNTARSGKIGKDRERSGKIGHDRADSVPIGREQYSVVGRKLVRELRS